MRKTKNKNEEFIRGAVVVPMQEEERLFFLSLVKKAKPKNDLEKRILKRLVIRTMGYNLNQRHPLYPPQECTICEKTIRGDRFRAHTIACAERAEREKQIPEIDPVVWEMLG